MTAVAEFEDAKKRLAVIAISTIARILPTAQAKLAAEGQPHATLHLTV